MLTLRTLPIAELQPAPYNPRVPLKPGTPGWRRLERSLREFDVVQPIVWNERTGHVVAGHQRLAVLKHQGQTEVEVAVVSLPLEREKALNIALNNTRVGSDWDPGKLIDLVAELQELPDFDATLTGFDEEDLKHLTLAPDPELPPEEDADAAEVVRITLEIPLEQWAAFRPELDVLLATYRVRPHIRLPQDSSARRGASRTCVPTRSVGTRG